MKNLDKYRGCLIGGAAGDALGYAVEILDEDAIFKKYGKKGITEYDSCKSYRKNIRRYADDLVYPPTDCFWGPPLDRERDRIPLTLAAVVQYNVGYKKRTDKEGKRE